MGESAVQRRPKLYHGVEESAYKPGAGSWPQFSTPPNHPRHFFIPPRPFTLGHQIFLRDS